MKSVNKSEKTKPTQKFYAFSWNRKFLAPQLSTPLKPKKKNISLTCGNFTDCDSSTLYTDCGSSIFYSSNHRFPYASLLTSICSHFLELKNPLKIRTYFDERKQWLLLVNEFILFEQFRPLQPPPRKICIIKYGKQKKQKRKSTTS